MNDFTQPKRFYIQNHISCSNGTFYFIRRILIRVDEIKANPVLQNWFGSKLIITKIIWSSSTESKNLVWVRTKKKSFLWFLSSRILAQRRLIIWMVTRSNNDIQSDTTYLKYNREIMCIMAFNFWYTKRIKHTTIPCTTFSLPRCISVSAGIHQSITFYIYRMLYTSNI